MPPESSNKDYRIYLAGRAFDPRDAPSELVSEDGYYIVQYREPLTRQEREFFKESYGLRFDNYIPNFAYLERMKRETAESIAEEPLLRTRVPYLPEYKISPEIGTHEFKTRRRKNLKGFLLRAILFPEADEEKVEAEIRALRAEAARAAAEESRPDDGEGAGGALAAAGEESGRASDEKAGRESAVPALRVLDDRRRGGQLQVVFTLPSTDLRLLRPIAELDEVRWIEEVAEANPDCAPEPNTVAGTLQSAAPGMTPVWDNSINGAGQTIGIIESTLVDLDHCMFKDTPNLPGASHRKVVGNRTHEGRRNRHATRVAAIAAGDVVCSPGANDSRGVAWGARLSLDDHSIIRDALKTILEVLGDEAADGARVHSNSWHDDTPQIYNQTAADVDSFVHQNEEHFVCGSSGNTAGASNEGLGPPGTAKNVLCVSASKAHPRHLKHGDGPSGPTPQPDGRRKPEICAPGCGINTALPFSGCLCGRVGRCASSWATPVVAGAAALVRQYYADGFHPTGARVAADARQNPSAALVKATLLNSTVPTIPEDDDDNSCPNDRTGWGLAVLSNTLFFAGGPRKLFVDDLPNAQGLDTGEARAHQLTVGGGGQTLKVTLVWSDAPASVGADRALVNDLDLIVTSPGGDTFRGNVNIVDGQSEPTAEEVSDRNNNVEMVIVPTPQPGTWTITVRCAAANVGAQGYGLVASGEFQ